MTQPAAPGRKPRVKKGPNKRSKGDGSVYQRKSDGMWVGSIELPSHDGRRRRKVITRNSETKAKAELSKLRSDKQTHGDLPTAGQTLATWMDYWFREIALRKVRPKTAGVYRTMINQYIVPAIGRTRLDKLTPEHVRRLERFITEPQGERKALSSTTAQQAHRVLAVALKYAHREGRVMRNVANLADAPRKARNTLTVLSPEHGIKVLQTVAGDPTSGIPGDRLGSLDAARLFTAARQGELLGLEISRVTDVLDLSWQMQRFSWEHGCNPACGAKRGNECPSRKVTFPADYEFRHITGGLWWTRPKSSAGWRIIPLVEPLRSIINRHIEATAGQPNPHGLVWTNVDGSPRDPSRDNKAWHATLKRAGVPDVRPHDSRHTTASILAKAGVNRATIIKIMGHSSYLSTVDYIDIDREQIEAGMLAISAALAPLVEPVPQSGG